MNKREIEQFLVSKQGYLKKSPIEVAKVLWKQSSKHTLPKNQTELTKELNQIKEVQVNLRKAKTEIIEDVNTELLDIYHKIIEEKNKPRRKLFFDIEVSPNIVLAWRVGREVNLNAEDIVQERAIICVAYRWSDEAEVKSLQWEKGDDYKLLLKFSEIINSADEIVTQNGDNFDVKWLRARCIYHRIPISPKFNSIDTLKLARSGFKFNSNKLDYIGKFLGVGEKIHTHYDLWKKILLENDTVSLFKMVEYCKQDVVLLENVYNELQAYVPKKKFKYGT